jgi:hypothetical protein
MVVKRKVIGEEEEDGAPTLLETGRTWLAAPSLAEARPRPHRRR